MGTKIIHETVTPPVMVLLNESMQAIVESTKAAETFTDANWATYFFSPVRIGTISLLWSFDLTGLPAGVYLGVVYDKALPVLGTDMAAAKYSIAWDGTAIITAALIEAMRGTDDALLAADYTAGGSPVSATEVIEEHTHYGQGRRSSSIIEVNAGFAGTLRMVPDLADNSTINTVDTVTIAGAATVTATTLRKSTDQKSALYDVPALSTTGEYEVAVAVTTVDGQTVTTTGALIVY